MTERGNLALVGIGRILRRRPTCGVRIPAGQYFKDAVGFSAPKPVSNRQLEPPAFGTMGQAVVGVFSVDQGRLSVGQVQRRKGEADPTGQGTQQVQIPREEGINGAEVGVHRLPLVFVRRDVAQVLD